MCLCLCVRARARACACVCVFMYVGMRVCVCACVRACVCPYVRACVYMFELTVTARVSVAVSPAAMCAHSIQSRYFTSLVVSLFQGDTPCVTQPRLTITMPSCPCDVHSIFELLATPIGHVALHGAASPGGKAQPTLPAATPACLQSPAFIGYFGHCYTHT